MRSIAKQSVERQVKREVNKAVKRWLPELRFYEHMHKVHPDIDEYARARLICSDFMKSLKDILKATSI